MSDRHREPLVVSWTDVWC